MIESFDRLDKDSKMFLFKELMKRFDLYKVYYHQHTNKNWEGYKANNIEAIYNVCEELFLFFRKYNHKNDDESPATTGGFSIFIREDKLYINYENREDKYNVGYTGLDALVIANIDYMDFLRYIKLNKIKNGNKRRSETIC